MADLSDFPASAANHLIDGFCSDFVQLATSLAHALEQISIRRLPLDSLRPTLARASHGMKGMAEAIDALLQTGAVPPTAKSMLAATGSAAPAPGKPSSPGKPAPATQRSAMARAAPPPAVATPAAKPPADAPPAPIHTEGALQGSNDNMPLVSVFQFIGSMRKSGTLQVQLGNENLTFEFVNGCVECTTSDGPPAPERLGDILIAMGFLQPEVLTPGLQKQSPLPLKLGAILVRRHLISNGQLLEALERQVHMRFHRAITSPQATYVFEEGERVPGDGRIRIRAFELMFESRRLAKQGP
ncbi:MAG TPA: DUF4388 domain-containing protein [Planctomycetota bacterium]|nr:DUF4388 domain-containing protein [Planctomycetota bacterium]